MIWMSIATLRRFGANAWHTVLLHDDDKAARHVEAVIPLRQGHRAVVEHALELQRRKVGRPRCRIPRNDRLVLRDPARTEVDVYPCPIHERHVFASNQVASS